MMRYADAFAFDYLITPLRHTPYFARFQRQRYSFFDGCRHFDYTAIDYAVAAPFRSCHYAMPR